MHTVGWICLILGLLEGYDYWVLIFIGLILLMAH